MARIELTGVDHRNAADYETVDYRDYGGLRILNKIKGTQLSQTYSQMSKKVKGIAAGYSFVAMCSFMVVAILVLGATIGRSWWRGKAGSNSNIKYSPIATHM